MMTTPEFQERYERIDLGSASAPDEGDLNGYSDCDELGELQNGAYVLRDPSSREDLVLASDLIAGRTEVGDDFFAPCAEDDADECFTRMRAYRRAFPGSDHVAKAQAALDGAGDGATGRFVRAVINSPDEPQWASDAFAALEEIEAANRQ
jgi:hypothetical protein